MLLKSSFLGHKLVGNSPNEDTLKKGREKEEPAQDSFLGPT